MLMVRWILRLIKESGNYKRVNSNGSSSGNQVQIASNFRENVATYSCLFRLTLWAERDMPVAIVLPDKLPK